MGKVQAMALPYKNFKHRILLTEKYKNDYYIENMDGYLYMVRRCV